MNIARILEALDFAADRHRKQRRKSDDDTPYINHPIRVAWILADLGGIVEEEILIAAILHDVVEDTETTLDELEERFGKVVRDMVAEVTDDKNLPKTERKRLQIVHAPQKSRGAAMIKLADKICNVEDLGRTPPAGWPFERVLDYFTWAEKVVAGLPKQCPVLEARFAESVARGRRIHGAA